MYSTYPAKQGREGGVGGEGKGWVG